MYYQSVYIFTNRIKIITVIKNTARIHQNFDICFWKKTKCWWIIKLNNIIYADFMINSNDVAEWCKVLKKRFKILLNQILQNLANICYTIADVQVCKSSTAYIIFIISAVKQCDQADTEIFKVTIISFINSVFYIQQQIKNVLQLLQEFIWIYIDNFIVFSHS